MLRINGDMREIQAPAVSAEDIEAAVDGIVSAENKQKLIQEKSLDFSIGRHGARFRVNIFFAEGSLAAVFRTIPSVVPSLDQIGAPKTMIKLARSPRGLVLVTGPTGSGKSTTLAAMIDLINSERQDHILTIEDPIEFVHQSKRCLVTQREIGRDATDFASALRDSLREDPDVILVGEMRDYETISIALTAAETGHLVLGTLHTSSAPSSIDRMIDAFPAAQQSQARVMLAGSLVGIVSQTLLPLASGEGRAAAHEILVANNPVRAHIRKGDTAQIRSVLQTGFNEGMQTADRSLAALVASGKVSEEVAMYKATSQTEFEQILARMRGGDESISVPQITAADLAQEMAE